MVQLFAKNSGYGIDNSPGSLGEQFVALPGSPMPDGTNPGNQNNFEVAFDGTGSSTEGKGWYQGSGFLNEATGIVSSLKVDFDGGNTQDVTIDQLSPLGITLDTFQAADWNFFQTVVFAGNDKFLGSAHDDVLHGYDGDDEMFGGYGDKPNSGSFDVGDKTAPDFVTYPMTGYPSDGDDVMDGGKGNDSMDGGTGSDTMYGGAGADLMYGGAGVWGDTLRGGGGRDKMYGDAGDDTLYGNKGNDRAFGGGGDDTIVGGAGKDLLVGGGGKDVFVFGNASDNDTIRDFNALSNKEDIDLFRVTAITNFQDLKNNHLTQDGNNAVIDSHSGVVITLLNVDITDLHNGDFIFVA